MVIEAIIIKTSPTREHDRLVTLYSRQFGKLSAIAKGALRAGSVQALQLDSGNLLHCDLVPARSGWPIMTGAQAIRCFSHLKSSPALWAAAQFFLQVMDMVIFDQEADEHLWACLEGTFARLDEVEASSALWVLRQEQTEWLKVLGYGSDTRTSLHERPIRTELDDFFDRLANRHLMSLDLVYELVNR